MKENKKSIVYIDMDDTLLEFAQAYSVAREARPYIPFPQSIPGFFSGLEPKPLAVEIFNRLFDDPKLDVYILTAPSLKNPLCYTEKRLWVEEHLGMRAVAKLIICPNKALLKGDYLIDDYAEGKGQESFEGKLIQFGTADYPDWRTVNDYFSVG